MTEKTLTEAAGGEVVDILRRLLTTQQVAVLATQQAGQPYTNLVGFAASDDLKSLFFATPRSTRKFANIQADGRVSMLFDNRSNEESDFHSAVGVTACGRAVLFEKSARSRYLNQYIKRHPYLRDFVLSPNCAFVRVHVDRYVIVQRFQEVFELVVE